MLPTNLMRRWIRMIRVQQPARRVALDVGLYALAVSADLLPSVRQRMAASRLVEDIEYAHHGDVCLRLDLLVPQSPPPHPVLVYLHGGAFAIGSKRTHRALAAAYASRGYLVCNVDYRLAPEHPFPAAIEDACAAWRWAVDHAAQHGGVPQRAALAGESAGANLALAVTLACCTPRPEPYAAPLFERSVAPRAVLLYCGFLQASMPTRHRGPGISALAARVAHDASHSYLGKSAERPGPEHALADPLLVVEAMAAAPRLPPIFIAVGLEDPVAEDSLRLARALQRLRSPCEVHEYPGETHAFHVMFWRTEARRCWRETFTFLDRWLPAQRYSGQASAKSTKPTR